MEALSPAPKEAMQPQEVVRATPEVEPPAIAPAAPSDEPDPTGLRPVKTYVFPVGQNPKLEVIDAETGTGSRLAMLELVVPVKLPNLGEVLAVEVDHLPAPGAQGHNWHLVEDFSQTRGELHIPILKRLLSEGDALPEEMQGGTTLPGVPGIVRVSATESRP